MQRLPGKKAAQRLRAPRLQGVLGGGGGSRSLGFRVLGLGFRSLRGFSGGFGGFGLRVSGLELSGLNRTHVLVLKSSAPLRPARKPRKPQDVLSRDSSLGFRAPLSSS